MAFSLYLAQPGPRSFSWKLGWPVQDAPGEANQYIVHAPPGAVDFTRIGTVHLNLGYAVGVTLPDGTQVGFRFEPPVESNAYAARTIVVPLAASSLYIVLHFVIYAAVLRHWRLFSAERNIFRYHVISAAVVTAIAMAMVVRHPDTLIGSVSMVSLHGIYSLSFLELWSLAQGGYSIAILREISGAGEASPEVSMRALGRRKVAARIESLRRLHLVQEFGESLRLTTMGRAAAAVQSMLLALTNSALRR